MASRVFFAGRLWTTPATMSAIDDSAMSPTSLTVGNVLAILGRSSGGKPNTILEFGNPSEVDAVLIGGDLWAACKKAFAPSAQTGGPSKVVAIRVGTPTQASLTLNDSTPAPVIDLVSDQYGLPANQVKVKVESGTTKGKKVTTQLGQSYYSQDNVARDAFTVQYAGGQASATMTVANGTVTLAAPSGTTVATIDLTSYPTVSQLVDRINAVSGFTAAFVPGSENTPALNGLDSVSVQDVKTALYTATANLQAIVDWLNGLGEGFVTATRRAGAGTVPANIPWTYLAGGTDTTPVLGDWTNALTTLQSADVQWVVPLTSDPAIHAAVDAHVIYMSTVARKERRAFVGPAAGTNLAAVKALPKAINSDRTSLVWPGYYDFDANGVLTLFAPYFSAVLVAAGFAGSNPGTPMTNKTLRVQGLETDVRNPTDTDDLIQAGVLCLENTPQGYKVVRSISTWLVNDNFNRVEVSCGAAADFVARNVREAVDVLRGTKQGPILLSRAISIAESKLRELARPEPQGPGVIVGDAKSPAYRNITAEIIGDVTYVNFECSPVVPANFFPISIAIVPYRGTASAAAA